MMEYKKKTDKFSSSLLPKFNICHNLLLKIKTTFQIVSNIMKNGYEFSPSHYFLLDTEMIKSLSFAWRFDFRVFEIIWLIFEKLL